MISFQCEIPALPCLPRIITIQSSPEGVEEEGTLTREEAPGQPDSGVNLYILAGHEAMQL